MIEMPTRSITRFFIPMIDVLTLLFCIYLLMPMVSNEKGETSLSREAKAQYSKEFEALEVLKKENEKALADIQKERDKIAESMKSRLSVRVLEIDGNNGKLFYRGPRGARIDIPTQAEAAELIKRDRERSGDQKRELYYLILYPRAAGSAYPETRQRSDYDRWFADVALGYDIPGVEGGS